MIHKALIIKGNIFFRELAMGVAGVATLALLAGCATTPYGYSPLTASEKEVIARIDPAASIVTRLSGQTIEVQNFTKPTTFYGVVGSEERFGEVYNTLSSYPQIYRIYEPAAERHCASINHWPDKGTVSGTHAMRFTCYQPGKWALVKMREAANECEELFRGPYGTKAKEEAFKRFFYSSATKHHPCQTRNRGVSNPPNEFCGAYTDLTKTSPVSEQTCAEYVGMAKRLEISMSEDQVQSRGSVAGRTFEGAKQECTDLGFSLKTEKHADCVLRLTK